MAKMIPDLTANIETKAIANVTAMVKRGSVSWAYFYTLLGFALTIETGIASMFDLPWAFVGLLVVAAVTIYLILFNGWFQNKLLGWKARYEGAEREEQNPATSASPTSRLNLESGNKSEPRIS